VRGAGYIIVLRSGFKAAGACRILLSFKLRVMESEGLLYWLCSTTGAVVLPVSRMGNELVEIELFLECSPDVTTYRTPITYMIEDVHSSLFL